MVLLTAAASAISSFRLLQQIDLGYDPNHVADFSIPVDPSSYATRESRSNYLRQLRDRVGRGSWCDFCVARCDWATSQ